jgi:hypothetical protein
MPKFDRTVEDISNIVNLEHVNTRVADQQLGVTFYLMGLGGTRDPYLMAGTGNMWINFGRQQFHLPTHPDAQVLNGVTGLVMPDRTALLERLASVKDALKGTQFSYAEQNDHVAVTCPWGNKIRVHEPCERFGAMQLGMPYVEINTPQGTADGIVRFYQQIMSCSAWTSEDNGAACANVSVGDGQTLIYRETADAIPEYDGHHIAVYLADFSGPYKKLLERKMVSEESDQHQYRFLDVFDPDNGEALIRIEHEVRSMRHPMYARPLVNRDPRMTNRNYLPGYEALPYATPFAG